MKILDIAIDNSVFYRRYYVLNTDVKDGGCNDKFFEGGKDNLGKQIKPLKQAKIWAKANGYTHVQVVRITRGKDKLYEL